MGLLPTARTQTFIPGDPIPAAFLNELQDQIIGQKHGTLTVRIPVYPPQTTGAGVITVFNGSGGNAYEAPVMLPPGRRIKEIRSRIKDSATGPTTMRFRLVTSVDGGGYTTVATSNTSSGSGLAQTILSTGLSHIVAAANSFTDYRLRWDSPAGVNNVTLYAAEIDIDNL